MNRLLSAPILKALIIFGFALVFQTANAAIPEEISVKIGASQAEYRAGDSIMVEVSYTNTADHSISMLIWNSALETRISSDFLSVLRDGSRLPYLGIKAKRSVPASGDYILISPGETVSASVDLRSIYAVESRGNYKVSYRDRSISSPGSNTSSKMLTPANAEFSLIEELPPIVYKQPPTFQSCSTAEQSKIDSALTLAESISLTARDDLTNTPVNSRPQAQRYLEWFGQYELSRWNTVQSHFNSIYNATKNSVLKFACNDSNCDSTTFAFVFPNDPSLTIYLCAGGLAAEVAGTDSLSGTIVHELSHFTVLGGTDDVVYGQVDARSLAITNPAGATNNADSHEFFAENNPKLPMPVPATKPVLVPVVDLILDEG